MASAFSGQYRFGPKGDSEPPTHLASLLTFIDARETGAPTPVQSSRFALSSWRFEGGLDLWTLMYMKSC